MNLIILGGARNVWEDYEACPISGDIMAIGNVSMFFPKPIHHLVTMHADFMGVFKEMRWHFAKARKLNESPIMHSHRKGYGVDRLWDINANGASSGGLAAAIGVRLGYKNIVLCGCPLDGSGNFYDPPWINDDFNVKHGKFGRFAEEEFQGKVKSMSGWTAEFLGMP